MTASRSPDRLFRVLAVVAVLAGCLVSCKAHAGDVPLPAGCSAWDSVPTSGLYALTPCSPPLPPATYLHPAYPEARPTATRSPSHATTTIENKNGVITLKSTTN